MVLTKDALTKSLKKGRLTAVSTLETLSKAGGLPSPVYTYEARGSTKRPSHFFKVRFRVPSFLLAEETFLHAHTTISGAGRCGSKKSAKSLAALQAVHRLEEELDIGRDGLRHKLEDYLQQSADAQSKLEALPVEAEIPNVSWAAIPLDAAMSAAVPASREGRIPFAPAIRDYPEALLMAKAMTLACQDELPDITLHGNQTDEGVTQRFANIRSKSDVVKSVHGHVGEESFGADYLKCVRLALQCSFIDTLAHNSRTLREWTKASNKLKKQKVAHHKRYQGNSKKKVPRAKTTFEDLVEAHSYDSTQIKNATTRRLLDVLMEQPESSFGMAKLLVKWPKHQFQTLKDTLETLPPTPELPPVSNKHHALNRKRKLHPDPDYHATQLQERIQLFRFHQDKTPLPIDSLEDQIPFHADVTIVCGGTGSGKTTRYPLMVSLFSSAVSNASPQNLVADQQDGFKSIPSHPIHMVVAQPRRLACQAAAKRVAFEQGYNLDNQRNDNNNNCPIGYSIRFESKPASPRENRTIDFQTIGVVLATAARDDPLLSHVTHLCIDEVHERNADMDLLLALAKKIQHHRQFHPTLPPLKIILMSATLDSTQWEDYFGNDEEAGVSIAKVAVPDATRFPIQILHRGDHNFPLRLTEKRKLTDEQLWKATAQLIVSILRREDNSLADGSILCFLPGMDEIRRVQRMLQQPLKRLPNPTPKILILHSSISSSRQARIFEAGPKCILSTNIAETSVTIPDVKYIVDPGRERQSTMLDDLTLAENVTVVGSQLVTVDIAQSDAKQRAGRAGRVAPGTCYRLYSQQDHANLAAFTQPEMLRMDLAQLVLHSISLCGDATTSSTSTTGSGDPLGLISGAPDPPPDYKLQQAVSSLVEQGLVAFVGEKEESDSDDTAMYCDEDLEGLDSDEREAFLKQFEDSDDEEDNNEKQEPEETGTSTPVPQLTYLGKAVSRIPASPRVGRMLVLGLALQAVQPALTIAALLSVPKVFANYAQQRDKGYSEAESCSDVIEQVEKFHRYQALGEDGKRADRGAKEYAQVSKVRRQLANVLEEHILANDGRFNKLSEWNQNGERVGAQAALICAVSQHVANLVDGRGAFATRDCAGDAKMHPSSLNFSHDKRSHWYVYNELRKTSSAFLHVTTAASPLELALFSPGGTRSSQTDEDMEELARALNWTHIADQWVPVSVSGKKQRATFVRLKEILNHDMLNAVSRDSSSFRENEGYKTIVDLVMSAVELQRRLPKDFC